MYLTFAESTGALDEATFIQYEAEAEAIIDWYTFDRLRNEEVIPEKVKLCMRKLMELLVMRNTLTNGVVATSESDGYSESGGNYTIKSQSNDGVSVSYNTIDASQMFNKVASVFTANPADSEFRNTVKIYLSGVKDSKGRNLLYRGLYKDE